MARILVLPLCGCLIKSSFNSAGGVSAVAVNKATFRFVLFSVFWFCCSARNDSMEPSKDPNLELVSAMLEEKAVFGRNRNHIIRFCSLVSFRRSHL